MVLARSFLSVAAGVGFALAIVPSQAAGVPAVAKSACLSAVNSQYGGRVGEVKVGSSEFSQANSIVMVKAIGVRGTAQSETWKCLVSNSGRVEDLSVAAGDSNAPAGQSKVSAVAKTACLQAVNAQYGGNVREVKVMRAEFSQANSEVFVKAIGVRGQALNEQWRCLVSSTGKVQDLSVIQR